MKTQYIIRISIAIALLAFATIAGAATSAQDPDLSVDPVTRLFPATAVGVYSAPLTFTITNKNGTETRQLRNLTLSGPNADQFTVQNDNCSGTVLSANSGTCTVAVRLYPSESGTKSANLLIPFLRSSATTTLTAFVTNYEAPKDQAQRRMPPVLAAVSIENILSSGQTDTLYSGQTYSITWSLEGYHEDYSSMAVLFDCTGISDGSCGANYDDATKFAESGALSPGTAVTGKWSYSGVGDKRFSYTWKFVVPATRPGGGAWAGGGTDVVVRFYSKDDVDQARASSSVSLLIPGNQASRYYDTAGRRILKAIKP